MWRDAKRKINEDFIRKGAAGINESDIKNVIDKADEIRRKFEKSGPLGRFIEDLKLLLSVVKDYYNGVYRQIPWWAITAIAFALLYVLSPVDLIPDIIPVVGLVDDAIVVSVCLLLVEQELQQYKEWKIRQSSSQIA